mmetsp:Transcript_45273/g.109583  ORF Transcript_45273/g.109583 Transcript_45273/m.109583 type:complete len:94 (-) Transcript_45273:918-1199(-)
MERGQLRAHLEVPTLWKNTMAKISGVDNCGRDLGRNLPTKFGRRNCSPSKKDCDLSHKDEESNTHYGRLLDSRNGPIRLCSIVSTVASWNLMW